MVDHRKQSLKSLGKASSANLGGDKEKYNLERAKILALLAIDQSIRVLTGCFWLGCVLVSIILLSLFA